ncbi:ABC transporter permease [Sphingobium sp. SCG-1]|uniref:amino acid ABC transporter permease n=1 Tax=Sphingobium sp. SCG-1 TaxID=2072936 RepID=UPI000CD6A3A3|nr:ABC transporter permease subunit [Sphingobium sp. SCG-1]AUW59353.1 ABC transporter permease [Sphingobium sp. SCG-1]
MRRRAPRTWRWWAPQVALLIALGLAFAWFGVNLVRNLMQRGIMTGFDFLASAARFPISETILPYASNDSLGWAFIVGTANTAFLTVSILLLSTLFGLPLALARRSGHPLAKHLSGSIIELVRNTPLVVQLLFWYGLITVSLPTSRHALQPLSGFFLTDRGLYFTSFGITGTVLPLLLLASGGLILIAALAWHGRLHLASLATLATVLACGATWVALDLGVAPDTPQLGRFNFTGGVTLTPEFVAVMVGSTLYASAFAAEIIRGGIDAVARGQWEAGAALGLTERQCLRLVIMPQALRVMIPPMTNQFISILKNSTIALVVGYPELNFIANTAMNHSGQAIEAIAILILVFLGTAGLIAYAMNRLNARVALVER